MRKKHKDSKIYNSNKILLKSLKKWFHYTLAVIMVVSISFSYGTFFPNPVAEGKLTSSMFESIKEHFAKINIKLDKITMQNKKDMEVSLYLDIHQPEFNYNDADSFMYAVKQCVDYLNYTTEIEKRIPSSIIIAMAGVESGWGTSRFAIEGNALFGVRTWDSKIPQMKAKGNPDADWGVKKYEHKCESIRDMIEIINRHPAYKPFRDERTKQLKEGKWNYKKLIQGLNAWSENKDYDHLIYSAILNKNLP